MKPVTYFKTTKVLRNIFLSLGAIFALVTAAHAQNLYVSAHAPGSHKIFEFRPDGTQSTYASGLLFPRGLDFESIGNLFAAEIVVPGDRDLFIGRVLKFNLRCHASTVGSSVHVFFACLVVSLP